MTDAIIYSILTALCTVATLGIGIFFGQKSGKKKAIAEILSEQQEKEIGKLKKSERNRDAIRKNANAHGPVSYTDFLRKKNRIRGKK